MGGGKKEMKNVADLEEDGSRGGENALYITASYKHSTLWWPRGVRPCCQCFYPLKLNTPSLLVMGTLELVASGVVTTVILPMAVFLAAFATLVEIAITILPLINHQKSHDANL